MPKTVTRFGVLDSRDPEANIRGGVKYLAYLSQLFGAGSEFVIAAYHAGEDRVAPCTEPQTEKKGESGEADCNRAQPDIAETKKHVQLVLQALDRRLEAAATADAVPVTQVTHTTGGEY